jgi:hypothetical protein
MAKKVEASDSPAELERAVRLVTTRRPKTSFERTRAKP